MGFDIRVMNFLSHLTIFCNIVTYLLALFVNVCYLWIFATNSLDFMDLLG